ncbi:MAG: YqgE/AlgH family protein, partial [Planctomycetota bacterium]
FRDIVTDSIDQSKIRDDDLIFRGGPVGGPLLALHSLAGVGEPCLTDDPIDEQAKQGSSDPFGSEIVVGNNPAEPWGEISINLASPPAWITGDDDHLRILSTRSDVLVRYVVDYSGWGPGQLDEELRVGGWLHCEADNETLFGDPDQAWQVAVDKCGRQILGTPDLVPGNKGTQRTDPGLN